MPQIQSDPLPQLPQVQLYLWRLDEKSEELASIIDNGKRMLAEASSRFKSTKRQQEWLATRALLAQTPYKNLEILYHNNGQPYLSDINRHISISHTQNYVAIAISATPIGIDIEEKGRNAYAAVKAYLQPEEIERLSRSEEPQKEALRLWTVKEAAFKATSGHTALLKEIKAERESCDGNTTRYGITCIDGSKATCLTTETEGFIASFCTPSCP